MAEKKSILEEALLDVKKIQEALNANTKEILRSVAKEEIDSVVKESILKENDFDEEDLDAPEDVATAEPEMDAEVPAELGGEESTDELGDIEGSEEVAPEMEPELGSNADALGGEPMDMTAASDDDVIAIYKKLSGEDEIEIVGDEIHLNISEPGEYVVKTNNGAIGGGEETAGTDIPTDLVPVETGADEEGDTEDGVDYEIAMDGEGDGEEVASDANADVDADSDEDKEEDGTQPIEELISTNQAAERKAGGNLTDIKGPGAKQAAKNESVVKKPNLVSETENKYKNLLTESNILKAENGQFREALKKFRGMLVETVVFNSNLTYVTKLFMEHSTTKAEKKAILSRFDEEVSNLKESKKLYKTIANELAERKPINESVESKIIKEVATSTSKQLNETTAYVDPSTKRIIDLINRVEKK